MAAIVSTCRGRTVAELNEERCVEAAERIYGLTHDAAWTEKEADEELKAAYYALEVARSYVDGQGLDGKRISPRETLEVVNAALAKAEENLSLKLMTTSAVATLRDRKRRLPAHTKRPKSLSPQR